MRFRSRRSALATARPAAALVRGGLFPTSEQEINQLRTYQGAERRLRHQRAGHHSRADLRRRANSLVTEMLGDDAIISSDFGGNPPLREDEAGREHLLQALTETIQRSVHHWRQVQQHRHLRNLSRHGRCIARAFQSARPDAAVRGDRARWSESRSRHERDARHDGSAGFAVPHLRVRLGREAKWSTMRARSTTG